MKLAVIVGHMDRAKGATMRPPFAFVQEYEYSTILSALIKQVCKYRRVDCDVYFRDYTGIVGTYKEVERHHPDAIVELHYNSFYDTDVRGTETLYANDNHYQLAESLHNELVTLLWREGSTDRGVRQISKGGRGYVNLTASEIPSVILEPFFGSNLDDLELGLMGMLDIAEGIVSGFINWMEDLEDA